MTLRVASPTRTKALAIRRAVPGGSLRASCAPLGAVTTAQVDPPPKQENETVHSDDENLYITSS